MRTFLIEIVGRRRRRTRRRGAGGTKTLAIGTPKTLTQVVAPETRLLLPLLLVSELIASITT